eukprot:6037904-Alexandrium_andersonii.AAC.1
MYSGKSPSPYTSAARQPSGQSPRTRIIQDCCGRGGQFALAGNQESRVLRALTGPKLERACVASIVVGIGHLHLELIEAEPLTRRTSETALPAASIA